MINYIRNKLRKWKAKKEFKEYGYEITKFRLSDGEEIHYAQWLHPFETRKIISDSKINFYKKLVQPGDFAIDVGAHTGDTTVPMAVAAGREGVVLALEPNPYVFKILEANAGLNRNRTNIVPLCFAATEKKGDFVFNYSDASFNNGGFLTKIRNQHHGHNYTLTVKGVNLKEYLEQNFCDNLARLALIKVDAEGYDRFILQTISGILQKYKPYILLECYKRLTPDERAELYTIAASTGYDLYYLDGHEERSQTIKINNKEEMNKWNHFEMLAIPTGKGNTF
jgi:FkbM family methyltransferase